MFENGFPKTLRHEVFVVEQYIPNRTYYNVKNGRSEACCTYVLQDGQTVSFPYRIYYIEKSPQAPSALTQTQKDIYHAIYSRSCDGYVREKHLRALLEAELREWAYPYILKLSDEYIIEILEYLYDELRFRNTAPLQMFCRSNLQQFLKSHDRMTSYWNEFYRGRCYRYEEYVGRKLYIECFGYSKCLEKLRAIQPGK